MPDSFDALYRTVPLLPELWLAVAAMALLMIGVFREPRAAMSVSVLSLFVLAGAAAFIVLAPAEKLAFFDGDLVDDGFARFGKLLILAGSVLAILLSLDFLKRENIFKFEYPVLILLATAGMMLMVSANDLIAMYLAIELQSLALYVIAAFHRDNVRSSEAGLKYFVLGALSSGLLLYGCSLIYGYTGSTSFTQIAAALQGAEGAARPSIGVIFGLVFVLAGLAFKVSAVPFHMWTPDVYEGAPSPVTAFFSAGPKIAAMALIARFVFDAFPTAAKDWGQIVIAVAVASMALGAFAAIGQRNIKRLMAYSSIGHVGFAFVGLASGTVEGVQGMLVYLAIYLAMTFGAFACIVAMRRDGVMVEDIDSLSGLAQSQPLTAFLLAMLMISLAGIPPLAGFFAKFYVFLAAIDAGLYWLAVFGVVASVVGAYYYLSVVKVIYFDAPAASFDPMAPAVRFVSSLTGLVVLLYFLWPAPLVEAAATAARALF